MSRVHSIAHRALPSVAHIRGMSVPFMDPTEGFPVQTSFLAKQVGVLGPGEMVFGSF